MAIGPKGVLFTDIEGSTRLLSEAAGAYRILLEDHRRHRRGFIAESLALYRETDNRFGVGWALWTLAFIAFRTDRFDKAMHPATEALRVFADGNVDEATDSRSGQMTIG